MWLSAKKHKELPRLVKEGIELLFDPPENQKDKHAACSIVLTTHNRSKGER